MNPLCVLSLSTLAALLHAHSMISYPQSMTPKVCRLGGDPNPGSCPGPCDLTAVQGAFSNYDAPSNPAGTFERGETLRTKYQRNNHGPGGFIRHSLVPAKEPMFMSHDVHDQNAFHYSCFGAAVALADSSDILMDMWGYNIVGNDGKKAPPAYYYKDITVPSCVPDGDYVLGWVWNGGTGGDVSNTGDYGGELWDQGYFTDYYSCSFIRIQGGPGPSESCGTPVFENDMYRNDGTLFSEEGCNSANDYRGVCTSEPCIGVEATFMKPRPFQNGNTPNEITIANFNDGLEYRIPRQTKNPEVVEKETGQTRETPKTYRMKKRVCRCIRGARFCGKKVALATGNVCRVRKGMKDQSPECIEMCCQLCRSDFGKKEKECRSSVVRKICNIGRNRITR